MFREAKLESTAQFVKKAFYSLYVVAAAADVGVDSQKNGKIVLVGFYVGTVLSTDLGSEVDRHVQA